MALPWSFALCWRLRSIHPGHLEQYGPFGAGPDADTPNSRQALKMSDDLDSDNFDSHLLAANC